VTKRTVQVQMQDNTIEKVTALAKTLHMTSRSDVVKMAVDVTEMVANAIADKGQVIIRDKHGKESKILIPGVN
jgi:hypothetical protein